MTNEAAWVAGFFDGEGSALIKRNANERVYLHLTISQVEREPLERVQELIGGIIYTKKASAGSWNARPLWQLNICRRADVQTFLDLVYPHLCSIKRAQVDGVRAAEMKNPPLGTADGWRTRRERYGPSGRKAA